MKIRICYILLTCTFLFFAAPEPLYAQLQFPGTPRGLNSGLKAADVMYVLPPPDPMEIEAQQEINRNNHQKPLRFALVRPANLSPETHGKWSVEGNLSVWRVHVISPGAHSVGLLFGRYELLPGVKLFVYDPGQNRVKGAFTSGNNKQSGLLPVGHIKGEELLIEMQVPSHMISYGKLELSSISHAFLDTGFKSSYATCPAGDFGCSQACEIDVNCSEGDAWGRTKSSVVRIYINKGNYGEYCTGVLVNNTAYDGTPYILTAEHCINQQEYAAQSIFRFNYESPACFGMDGPVDMELEGADLISVGDSIDFSLVRLSHTPPDTFGVYYAGWDRSTFQTNSSATIHHPFGDVKKISFDNDIPSIPAQPGDVPYSGLEDYHYYSYWWIKQWDVGSTEGGSSGGPLFNQARQVIGTLSGGNAFCGDSIDYDTENDRVIYNLAPNYDDYFTQFGMAWNHEEDKGNTLIPWLDPTNSGIENLEGYTPTSITTYPSEKKSRFHVFPNPAKEIFQITSKSLMSGEISYEIVNLSGAVLKRGQLIDGNAEVNISGFPPGLYLLFLGDKWHSEHHKIIILSP